MKSITMTDKDPEFFAPEIKSLLRKRNKLFRANQIDKANALATKINTLIIRNNSQKLSGNK